MRPIEALTDDWPGADPASFSGAGAIAPEHMTVFGFVINGVNYVGGCQTRQGPYPFCAELDLPSYSLAKSLVAGLGLMRVERLYPGAAAANIRGLRARMRRYWKLGRHELREHPGHGHRKLRLARLRRG